MGTRSFLLALLLLALLPASAAANAGTRIIVKRDGGLTAAERADIRADAGVRIVETLEIPRTEIVVASAGDTGDALLKLNADPDVLYAERDRRRAVAATDSHWTYLWGLQRIAADDTWQLQNVTGDAQVVAVVDSGVDSAHPDLLGQIHSATNFVDEDGTDASDGDGHGTHVSGTIAARYDNGEGIAGVAPGAGVMALRALDDDGSGYDSDIAEAFDWAGDHGVRVVNASLGGEGASQTLREAIHGAPETLFVVAAANDGSDNDAKPIYPCNTPEPNVLCVGATGQTDAVASFSNFGARSVDVFAPGVSIVSSVPGASYGSWSGTSMATPHVSAVAALVLEAQPLLTAEQLKEVLLESADPDGRYDAVSVSGARINALEAVRLALAGTSLPDADGDGWSDAADACPATQVLGSPDGCPLDDDWDGVLNGADNCKLVPNPDQANLDGDAWGDACDPDIDGDGVLNRPDACDTKPGPASNAGCPLPPTAPTPTPTMPAPTPTAPMPTPTAPTPTPISHPQVSSVSATVTRRRATVRVVTSGPSRVRIAVERKKGRRWVRVVRRARSGTRATLKVSRLKRGRHRVRISISSAGGRGESVTKGFRVR